MTSDELEAWLRLAADRLHASAAELTKLDQAIGDGDHGTNMDRGFTAIVAKLDAAREAAATPDGAAGMLDPAGLLKLAGKTLISTVGGAAGPLYGTAFLRAGGAVADRPELSAADGVAALEAAIGGSPASARRPSARRRCSTH